MYDRVLVITINLYYSKVPSTAVLLKSTVPTTVYSIQYTLIYHKYTTKIFYALTDLFRYFE